MPFLERAGHPAIHYVVDDHTDPWREAPVLMLQHGYSRSAAFWYHWVPYLSRHFRVVRMDLRGLGRSSSAFDLDHALTPAHMIDDMLALMDALGARSVHYCGESLGGILGVMLAAEHPERLRTLSLIGAPLGISERTKKDFSCGFASWQDALRNLGSQGWSSRINDVVRFPPGTDPAITEWYARETGKSDVNVLIKLSEVACSADLRPYLPRVSTPTLGLYPQAGTITGSDDEVFRRSLRDFRLVRLPTRFHAIQFLMPAACATEVLHFAAQFDGFACHE